MSFTAICFISCFYVLSYFYDEFCLSSQIKDDFIFIFISILFIIVGCVLGFNRITHDRLGLDLLSLLWILILNVALNVNDACRMTFYMRFIAFISCF